MQRTKVAPDTIQEVLERYPRLTAHLICESLGYFTPEAAANAIMHHRRKESFACEWYIHMAQGFNTQRLIEVGRKTIERAFRSRHHHQGFMAHYPQARALVEHVRGGGQGPLFASWF